MTSVDAVGSTGQKLIWLNTFNGWAEATTVEPTVDKGPKYPAETNNSTFWKSFETYLGHKFSRP